VEPLTPAAVKSWQILDHLARQGGRWAAFYSGGKDSAALATLLGRWGLRGVPPELHVLYVDTRIEPPPLQAQALAFLQSLKDRYGLNVHTVEPDLDERFWVNTLGRGYPPPNRKFRWCTDRLKLRPGLRFIKQQSINLTLVGARFGESTQRTHRLNNSCNPQTGECGTGTLANVLTTRNMPYIAPLLHWTTGDVWRYLQLAHQQDGLALGHLFSIYNGGSLRFGCWVCTLVKRDRSGEALMDQGHEVMAHLLAFRSWFVEESAKVANRFLRKNGVKGRLSLIFRKRALEQLEALEEATQIAWLTPEERRRIRELWENPRYGPYV